jgi:hypothetical protein
MSEWDFLWGLKGEALKDAMAFGIEQDEWNYRKDIDSNIDEDEYQSDIDEQHRIALKAEWEELKALRDTGSITIDEFRRRKIALFPAKMRESK